MAAKIYDTPLEIKIPDWDFSRPLTEYREKEERFIKELKEFLIRRNNNENVGEIIHFPVADGQAQYMVASLSPLELVHLPLGDAWEFEYAKRLTKKDVIEKIKQRKAIEKLFNEKRNDN